MDEYIKRSNMRAVLERASINPRFADEPPAAEVAPVVHGRWLYSENLGIAVCTECGFERDLDLNFGKAISCPNCGAKMDKEES